MECEVRDATELDRTPIFDNAPFLHLRPGDKLVKAKINTRGKGPPAAEPSRSEYCLLSGGRYFLLRTNCDESKLRLESPDESLLFD